MTNGIKINNNDEQTHFFTKIYLSHFIRKGCERVAKWLCVRGELETEQTARYWPPVPLTIAALLFAFCLLLNRGSWGPKPSAGSWFSLPGSATRITTNLHQLTRTVSGTGLYNCLPPTCFPWASQLHRIQPVYGQGYILVSSTGCNSFLIDDCVEGQYVTYPPSYRLNSTTAVILEGWLWH